MELKLKERFLVVERFVLQERQQVSILGLAAAVLVAYAIVGFARSIGSAIVNTVILAVPATFLGSSIQPQARAILVLDTLVTALLSLAVAAIGLYVLAWWSQRQSTSSKEE